MEKAQTSLDGEKYAHVSNNIRRMKPSAVVRFNLQAATFEERGNLGVLSK